QLNTLRFKSFHQLDIRIDKNFFFRNFSLMTYLDIQNAYNFQNKGQDYIVRSLNEDGSFETTDNGARYVLKSIENFSGTILPTVGIMIKF
ncbi:MAG TPA: ferric aerobactin receptor, partial [Saprospirales bacterium]|nr:ferric aerobactin receptor [Saprospirales bacterium]